MKRPELIEKYSKILNLKNYSSATEKLYLHHLNLFLDYVNKSRDKEIDGGFLLNYFTHLKQTKTSLTLQ